MTIQWEDNFVIITTNSTMLSASFDRSNGELEFNVEGTTGNSSLCNVSFPQSLISDVNNLKVRLDNNQIAFNYTVSDNMVKLGFLYTNSEHVIKVSTQGATSSISIPGYYLWITLGICLILFPFIIKRKNPKFISYF